MSPHLCRSSSRYRRHRICTVRVPHITRILVLRGLCAYLLAGKRTVKGSLKLDWLPSRCTLQPSNHSNRWFLRSLSPPVAFGNPLGNTQGAHWSSQRQESRWISALIWKHWDQAPSLLVDSTRAASVYLSHLLCRGFNQGRPWAALQAKHTRGKTKK